MEFWGIEVKPGESVKCEAGNERVLHLSQASLGESKKEKGSENVPIFVNVNNQKLVIGTLSSEKCAQIQYDLVFEKEFELSHGSKNTSVFFVGYRSIYHGYESEDDFSDSESEEDLVATKKANVLGNSSKIVASNANAKKDASSTKGDNVSAKSKAKAESKDPIKNDKKKKVEDKDEDDSDDDDDDDDDSEESDDEDMVQAPGDNSSDEDEDESSEEDGTPKKVESAIKRKADSASKTPIPEKKAKLVTPAGNQKTGGDGKKAIHIATPYPAKQGGKPQQSPKSGGTVACKSCNRTFISDNALQAHTKAKHGVTAAK